MPLSSSSFAAPTSLAFTRGVTGSTSLALIGVDVGTDFRCCKGDPCDDEEGGVGLLTETRAVSEGTRRVGEGELGADLLAAMAAMAATAAGACVWVCMCVCVCVRVHRLLRERKRCMCVLLYETRGVMLKKEIKAVATHRFRKRVCVIVNCC